MSDKPGKILYTIDHANKLREGQGNFNPYSFWLKQEQRRAAIEARSQRNCSPPPSTKEKQELA